MELKDVFNRNSAVSNDAERLQMPFNIPKVFPEVRVGFSNRIPDAGGWVFRDNPNVMWINSEMPELTKRFPQTVPHEFEHVLQNRVSTRHNQSYDQQVLNELSRISGQKFTAKYISDVLQSGAKNKEIPRYFQEKYGYPIAYWGNNSTDGAGKDNFSLREQWAELSAAEQHLKKDLTKDPFVLQNMFNNDPELVATYKGTTGLRTDRLDARDLPPMTGYAPLKPPVQAAPAATSWLDGLKSLFR